MPPGFSGSRRGFTLSALTGLRWEQVLLVGIAHKGDTMRKSMLALAMSGALTLAGGPALAAPTQLTATMTAEEETPTPGPAGAKGTGVFQADSEAGQLCYELTYEGPGEPNAAHIHKGEKGTSGPVAVDLAIETGGMKSCVPADGATLQDIIANPAGYYANIHTPQYKAGAVRGQLTAG